MAEFTFFEIHFHGEGSSIEVGPLGTVTTGGSDGAEDSTAVGDDADGEDEAGDRTDEGVPAESGGGGGRGLALLFAAVLLAGFVAWRLLSGDTPDPEDL